MIEYNKTLHRFQSQPTITLHHIISKLNMVHINSQHIYRRKNYGKSERTDC